MGLPTRGVVWAFAGLATLLMAGCGSGDAGASSDAISVDLADYSIDPATTKTDAGTVTLSVHNGAEQTHEFVVMKTDRAADELPTGADGNVDEEGADDLEVVDEVEDIEGGATKSLTLDLAPGHYVFVCNLPGHYQQGMSVGFDVSG